MSLPTDIVDYILSFSQVSALESCAQSHPILSKLVERHLYSTIILHDEPLSPHVHHLCLRISQLTKRLSDNAHVANYVRNLTIYVNSDLRLVRPTNLEDILPIMPMFSQLRKVTFSDYTGRGLSWQRLSMKFRSAFFNTLNQQPLKDVSIGHISGFPLSLLDNCETVRSLTLYRCSYVHHEGALHKPGPATLESLSIRDCDKTSLRNIIAWVRTRRVRSLEFLQRFELFPQLLSGCVNSLTDLTLDFENIESVSCIFLIMCSGADRCWLVSSIFKFSLDDNIPELLPTINTFPFTLSAAPHLKKLSVCSEPLIRRPFVAYLKAPYWQHYSDVPAITQLIRTAPPSLEELILKIKFNEGQSGPLPNGHVIWSPFIPLATECSSLPIKVYLSARFRRMKPQPAVISDCKEMTRFVEQGVFILMPPASEDA